MGHYIPESWMPEKAAQIPQHWNLVRHNEVCYKVATRLLTSSIVLRSLKDKSIQPNCRAGSTKSLCKVLLKSSQWVSMLLFTFRAVASDSTISTASSSVTSSSRFYGHQEPVKPLPCLRLVSSTLTSTPCASLPLCFSFNRSTLKVYTDWIIVQWSTYSQQATDRPTFKHTECFERVI